ncbi:MAG TPA: hypothetical protein VIQ30_25495 [Pseudonocardia sp.]
MGTEAPDGSIVITPKEFYDGVRSDVEEIKKSISGLSSAVGSIPTRVDKLEMRLDAADTRIGQLEARVWRASGFAAAVGLAAAWIVPALLK